MQRIGNAIPIGQQTRNMANVVLKPMKSIGGVQNKEILVQVGLEPLGARNISLNRLTILAYTAMAVYDDNEPLCSKTRKQVYKLWTSGGFNFYTESDDFLGEKDEEKDKSVEAGVGNPPANEPDGGKVC